MRRLPALALASVLAFAARRPGAATDAIAPREPTAAEAFGSTPATSGDAKCTTVDDYGKPLVVDLKAEERGDFEAAMKEGVAVVTYDCKTLKLVDGCSVDGTYGYLGLSPKEELVRLQNADELKANLPISAGAFGAKLGGELDRGMSLDIAMMIVGKRRTTRRSTVRGDLVEDRPGACKRATHFVRGATLGAFVMESGSRAKARTAAELFGIPKMGNIGVSGGSSSNRETSHRDGSVDACKGASPDARNAPGQCSAILRLELTAIDEGGRAAEPVAATAAAPPDTTGGSAPASTGAAAASGADPLAALDDESVDACPAGFVMSEGKCTKAASAQQHRCKPGDLKECTEQCDRGEAASCGRLGAIYQGGKGVAADPKRAAVLYDKSCQGGWDAGCASLGALYVLGEGVTRDPSKGTELLQKACDAGAVVYCDFLGKALYFGNMVPKDEARAFPLLVRGCEGGTGGSCYMAGRLLQKGQGVAQDAARGTGFMRKGCDGGDGLACLGYGSALARGNGVQRDPARSAAVHKRLCEQMRVDPRFGAEGCGAYGVMLAKGIGVNRDPERARSYVDKACGMSKTWCGKEGQASVRQVAKDLSP